jgi:thiol-disulfide isomerase/thioredoxin
MTDDSQIEHSKNPLRATIIISAVLLIIAGLAISLWFRYDAGNQGSMGERVNAPENFISAIPRKVDFPAPEFFLSDLDGIPVSLSDHRGKLVLVNIWAFWCTPCRYELPILQDYYEDHRDQDFVVIGIEAGGETEDVVYHVKYFELTFPNWQDPNGNAPREFRMGLLPSSYLIDKEGRVILSWSGAISRVLLDQYVTPILEE